MSKYDGEEFNAVKKWVTEKINNGSNWEDVMHLCVAADLEQAEFKRLKNDEMIIPDNMDFAEWSDFIRERKSNYTEIVSVSGIAEENKNGYKISGEGSAWADYKKNLANGGKMSETAINTIETNSAWILNHLEPDTKETGPVKGLVMGSVQSGKTANMIGLVTMAADNDWNIFIVLSGTIENLRKQTQKRFSKDLQGDDKKGCGGLTWHILDYSGNPDYVKDLDTGVEYLSEDLYLNGYMNGKSSGNWLHRYVIVCLKNSVRLQRLIEWLHAQKSSAAKMRIVLIDDEADQASINTKNMEGVIDEDEIERTKVNQLIINLVRGCDKDGEISQTPFQAMNYISYTATPYANVLNEAYRDSLYPSNFICSLPESDEYFGPKVIWGSKFDNKNYPGFEENIIRTIPNSEMKQLKSLKKNDPLPFEFQNSVAWFLCTAAILRNRGSKKPVSMLIHTTPKQIGHFSEYEVLKDWLETSTNEIVHHCEKVYEDEKDQFRLRDLQEGYPHYAKLSDVCDEFPQFDEIRDDIYNLLQNIINIKMDDEKQPVYQEDAIHLCVDNCKANRYAEDGVNLRVIYDDKSLDKMNKAPVFIVIGGNTLSRGLTLEGLVCTYFARNVSQADTLMQMARWFGYRSGCELLQRVWLTSEVNEKFRTMEEIDERLKTEIESFREKGKSPSAYGPKVMDTYRITKFTLTSKNKSQNMVPSEIDFSGDSYEITKFFDYEDDLKRNLKITEDFLTNLGVVAKSETRPAYVWYGVDSDYVINRFIREYKIFECSTLHADISDFVEWIKNKNREGKLLKWNVAVAGNEKSESRWRVAGADVGKVERNRIKKCDYVDIYALRSGSDILCDVRESELNEEQKRKFNDEKKNRTNRMALRSAVGLGNTPLLLLYRIDKEKGKKTNERIPLGTSEDIVAYSIIIADEDTESDKVKTVQVKKPEI